MFVHRWDYSKYGYSSPTPGSLRDVRVSIYNSDISAVDFFLFIFMFAGLYLEDRKGYSLRFRETVSRTEFDPFINPLDF